MTPWLQDADVTLYHGDVLQVLRELPAESVDCCVTSPPYWGLRDYGTGAWEGGDEGCDHRQELGTTRGGPHSTITGGQDTTPHASQYRDTCGKCGATRIDQQLGLEPTPEEYVTRMVEVFREVRRVLAPHGTVWLNLGDSYAANRSYQVSDNKHKAHDFAESNAMSVPAGLKAKDLVGVPWRVAFALQADGWYLRSDIIWAKPNPMPESVTDRPTKAHEYVFLLSKQPRYYWDAEAIREPHNDKAGGIERFGRIGSNGGYVESERTQLGGVRSTAIAKGNQREYHPAGRNSRSVWEIATQPYPEAHFATFPEELARRCIAAGTSERGRCPECGTPWVREVEREGSRWEERKAKGAPMRSGFSQNGGSNVGGSTTNTIGWQPSCASSCVNGAKFRTQNPCVVLDPFVGSGTVAHVARKLGRHAVGIDLNESYLELAARRLQQQSLFAEQENVQ